MSPVVITYGGVFVAVLIIFWGVFEMSKRFFTHRRSRDRHAAMWVTMRPKLDSTEDERTITSGERQQDSAQAKKPTRANQNGHYTESKKKI